MRVVGSASGAEGFILMFDDITVLGGVCWYVDDDESRLCQIELRREIATAS